MTKIMFPYQYHHSYRRFQHLALYLKPKKEWMVSKKMGPEKHCLWQGYFEK
jgi:hypothetical protein